jgi:hypothetical protein
MPLRSALAPPLALAAFTLLLASATCLRFARASDSRFGTHDVRSVFTIGKNVDHNEVHYGIRLDPSCAAVGDAPIYAYWTYPAPRRPSTADLNWLDRTVYGIKEQRVLERSPAGSRIEMTLRPTDRPITVVTGMRGAECVAEPITAINGVSARLDRVFVHVVGPFAVDWVEIHGSADGKPIVERVKR